jgi:hypothetical protein
MGMASVMVPDTDTGLMDPMDLPMAIPITVTTGAIHMAGTSMEEDTAGEVGIAGKADAAGEAGTAGKVDAAGEVGIAGKADAAGEVGIAGKADAAGEAGIAGKVDAAGEDIADADSASSL